MRFLHFVAVAVWVALGPGSASAQFVSRAAEPCDCTATCPPASSNAFRITEFAYGNGSDLSEADRAPIRWSEYEALIDLSAKKAAGGDEALVTSWHEARLLNEFEQSLSDAGIARDRVDWDAISKALVQGAGTVEFLSNRVGASPDRVIEPGVGKSDIDPGRARNWDDGRRRACLAAVEDSATERAQACKRSIEALCKEGCDNDTIRARLNPHDPDLQSATRQQLEEYTKACLSKDHPSTDVVMRPEAETALLSRTGFLVATPRPLNRSEPFGPGAAPVDPQTLDSNHASCDRFINEETVGGTFCTAVVSDDQTILTARHCFFQREAPTAWNYAKSCLDVGRLEFRRTGSGAPPAVMKSVVNASSVRSAGGALLSDFLRLTPVAALEQVTGSIARASPRDFDHVLIPGFNPLFIEEAAASAKTAEPALSWSKGGCRVIMANENCALTRCQTFGGTSGAPVWRIDPSSGSLQLAGLHVRDGLQHISACRFPAGTSVPQGLNVALSVDRLK